MQFNSSRHTPCAVTSGRHTACAVTICLGYLCSALLAVPTTLDRFTGNRRELGRKTGFSPAAARKVRRGLAVFAVFSFPRPALP